MTKNIQTELQLMFLHREASSRHVLQNLVRFFDGFAEFLKAPLPKERSLTNESLEGKALCIELLGLSALGPPFIVKSQEHLQAW